MVLSWKCSTMTVQLNKEKKKKTPFLGCQGKRILNGGLAAPC